MYLAASRPDIRFAVCACVGLWYSKDSPLELVAYTDSDYARATQDRKSTTGGLEEFKEPEENKYGPRDSSLKPTTGCNKESDNSKENTDDSLEQHQMTDTETSSFESPLKVDKDWKEKFFYPANHVESVNQIEKPSNKGTIWNNARRVNHHNSHIMSYPHPKRNFVPKAVLMKTRMRLVNVAKPKAAYNAIKRNRFNVVKASACWVWMPKNRVVDHVSKNISASLTLKRLDYIDATRTIKSVMAGSHKKIFGDSFLPNRGGYEKY
ncbi:hypothetical protein Tco_0954282 [Tanacetum coccineum]|uniref:Uncharacterized protein n=1 Tax=Tanacetum coccineum TaxID=301880 RepID=A0ABQ5E2C1_9ASTR